jgi:hypothetical protein
MEVRIMSHSILFVVSKPGTSDYRLEETWHGCVSSLSDLANKKTGVELLAENILLIPLHGTLEILSQAVHAAKEFQYKYAIFDEDIRWYEVAKKP